MKWKVINESIPLRSIAITKRDELLNKLGFNNLLEFLCEFSYNKNELENSYSFLSCTSSNIVRNR